MPLGPAEAVELSGVPFHAQDAYQCGPAALAMVLGASGVSITPEALVSQVYVPGRRGSLQAEMIAATRRQGRVPLVLPPHAEALQQTLRDDQPVLVLQNLGWSWIPRWHYAVVVGFDPLARTWTLHSGTRERVKVTDRQFQARWARAGRWALLASPPERIPAAASALDWVAAANAFEALGQPQMARRAYQAATLRWPESALVWQASANLAYQENDLAGAEQALRRALAAEADAATRNNLAQVLLERGCRSEALQQLDALGEPPAAFREAVQDTRRQAEALSPVPGPGCGP